MDLVNVLQHWEEIIGGLALLWSEGAARAKVWHVKLPFRLGRTLAITLFPFVFYSKGAYTTCLRAHEDIHVAQVRRLGLLLFYARYLVLQWLHGSGRDHPMERWAYQVSDDCVEAQVAAAEARLATRKDSSS